jgi:hypothetical protein
MTVPNVRQPNVNPGLQDQTSIALNLFNTILQTARNRTELEQSWTAIERDITIQEQREASAVSKELHYQSPEVSNHWRSSLLPPHVISRSMVEINSDPPGVLDSQQFCNSNPPEYHFSRTYGIWCHASSMINGQMDSGLRASRKSSTSTTYALNPLTMGSTVACPLPMNDEDLLHSSKLRGFHFLSLHSF